MPPLEFRRDHREDSFCLSLVDFCPMIQTKQFRRAPKRSGPFWTRECYKHRVLPLLLANLGLISTRSCDRFASAESSAHCSDQSGKFHPYCVTQVKAQIQNRNSFLNIAYVQSTMPITYPRDSPSAVSLAMFNPLTSRKTQATKRHYVMQSKLLMRNKSASVPAIERPQICTLQRDEGLGRSPYMVRSTSLSVSWAIHRTGCGPLRFPRQHEPWPNKTVLFVISESVSMISIVHRDQKYSTWDQNYSPWAFLTFRDRRG